MVRSKGIPKQKDATEQQNSQWSLEDENLNAPVGTSSSLTPGTSSTHLTSSNDGSKFEHFIDLINDESEESDSDTEYIPKKTYNKKVTFKDESPKIAVKKKVIEKMDYGGFKDVLAHSNFKVKIVLKPTAKIHCLFGNLQIELKDFDKELFKNADSLWLYISDVPSMSAIYFEWNDNTSSKNTKANKCKHFSVKHTLDKKIWEAISTQSYFQIILKSIDENRITVEVFFLKQGLANLESGSDYCKGNKHVAYATSYFLNIDSKMGIQSEKNLMQDFDILYKYVKNHHNEKLYDSQDAQHPSLIPILRPYQKAAVQWMLYQERCFTKTEMSQSLHPLFIETKSADDVDLYYNIYGCFFVSKKPESAPPYPGGILADEMGLGKTVEVLACLLCNPRGQIPVPPYKEPIVPSIRGKFMHKINPANNVFTVDVNKEEKASDKIHESQYKMEIHPPGQRNYSSDQYEGINNSSSYLSPVKLQNNGNDEANNGNGDSLLSSGNRHEKRKRSSRSVIDYSLLQMDDDDDEYMPKKAKLSTPKDKYDPQKEIDENAVLSSIENTILNECWNGSLKAFKREGSFKEFRNFLKRRKRDPFYMMTLREKLTLQYNSSMAEYSAKAFVQKAIIKDFFTTKIEQKSYFECMCGKATEMDDELYKVQCSVCSLWQHSDCVQYDVSNPYRGEYICPHCWTTQTPVVSGATLIVSPSTISYQWVDEILKHIKEKSIRMLVYKGVSCHGYMQPQTLAEFDIVITTYETLRSEVNYVDIPHSNSQAGRRFRFPKRFMAVPSPLPCVEWWRICLDEAQMAECRTTRAAEMAVRLSAKNRWCVTGTPIQRTINDLQGLLFFLGVDPYYVQQWWQRCLYYPYCFGNKDPLLNVIAKYMWRNSKNDVKHEVDIPDQTMQVHWLNFTPVEEHFYRRLHSECSAIALQRISKFSDTSIKLKFLDKKILGSLLLPLGKLRQACNHPQVVRGNFVSLNQKTLTMEQLLENLIKKTQVEAEDAHRILVASYNGLAAICIIRNEFSEAVGMYRTVLQSVEEHKSSFKTDSLQRLHTIHNLAEILQCHQDVAPTLRDSNLATEAEEIRSNYLKQYPVRVADAEKDCQELTDTIIELKSKFHSQVDWWMAALESFNDEFVEEVRDELLSQYSRFEENKCILYPIKTRLHLLKLLEVEMKKLDTQRTNMRKGVKDLLGVNPVSIVGGAIDCHLRPTADEPPHCLLCKIHEHFECYEETLFFMKDLKHTRLTEKSKETEDVKEKAQILLATRKGNWGQSEIERVLRYLQTKSLSKVDSEIYEDSQMHFQVLAARKKEFKHYRILWRAIYDHVSAIDEVNMATIRFRLKLPDEELPNFKKKEKNDLEKRIDAPTYIFEECDIPQQELKLKSEKIVSENELRVKLGQLFYLKRLQKADYCRRGGSNPEPCPVCQGKLGEKWAVMQCGHSYCIDCIKVLTKRAIIYERGHTKCPMCRQPSRSKDISYVDIHVQEEEEVVKIQGSLSTKMEGVVRQMLKIKTSDPQAKVLIFSSWNDVLEVIGDALAQNGITYRILHANQKFQENLSSFKTKKEITALLLPINSGANGLNLIEARHIILVDPILNPASELQALGRVHRIGQTKCTVVHRFLIRGTIEERMHSILVPQVKDCDSNYSGDNPVTVNDLKKLFTEGAGPEEEVVIETEERPEEDALEDVFELI